MRKASESATSPVDLSTCAREPIHTPGSVQPHGFLLALEEPGLIIRHASRNCEDALGLPADQLLGKPLQTLLSPAMWLYVLEQLQTERLKTVNPLKLKWAVGDTTQTFDAIAHRRQGLLLLEFEPALDHSASSFSQVYQQVHGAVEEISTAANAAELYRATAEQVKALTGYQRVMIYEFDKQWNGNVVAEAREPELEPFLGLRYPASDIPEQARQLYRSNWLRIIPNVHYTPAAIIPATVNSSSEPLDLSGCVLRSVSPMHVQYLKNMGVGASMSVSIIKDGELWGLIALHHHSAAYLPYEVRQGLEFIGRFLSSQLAAKQQWENHERKLQLNSLQRILQRQMQGHSSFMEGLHQGQRHFLDMAEGVSGGAIWHRTKLGLHRQTPQDVDVAAMVQWLAGVMPPEGVYCSECLTESGCPGAQGFKDVASGVLAIAIPEVEPSFIIWFKPEVIQTVNWGGNPEKPVEPATPGGQLGPRRSFALWQQTVRQKSLPWQREEIEAVTSLRRSIIEIDLERQVRVAMDSNAELDQFASVIAHDLKEPLRGIKHYAEFLEQDLAGQLDPESLEHVQGIRQLSQKTAAMLTELYQYSRLGQVEMSFAEVDLNSTVDEVRERLQQVFASSHAQLRVVAPLPVVICDKVRITEVLANLLSNAVKYNRHQQPLVEVGAEVVRDVPVFYVRDNGIGIEAQAQTRVFNMFQRLHSGDDFGGTGVGLAIVKRIIDRHGGRVWLESAVGEGSTFYFTLRPAQPNAALEGH